MKYVGQFLRILLFCFAGELLKYLIPLPIPASIYGLVLLFLALQFRLIKVECIRETAKFLIEIMPVMFIPAGAGLMTSWGALQKMLVPVVVITIVSTVVVMAAAGKATEGMLLLGEKSRNRGESRNRAENRDRERNENRKKSGNREERGMKK